MLLGLLWQVIKQVVLEKINLKHFPKGEQLSDLLKLNPEELLLRWFNYHLKAAGYDKNISNFSNDIKDSEKYTILLNIDKESSLKVPTFNNKLKYIESLNSIMRVKHFLDEPNTSREDKTIKRGEDSYWITNWT